MPIPNLSKNELYHSHLVNCSKCHEKIRGNPSVTSSYKIRDLLCPVGKKLFDEAIRENPKSVFRPLNFPFVAKMYQTVLARTRDGWIKAKVVDRSLAANGAVMGYEVEYEIPGKLKPTIHRLYVNRNNIKKAGDGTPLKAQYEVKAQREIKTHKITIRIGEKPKPEPEKPKFRFRIVK